MTRATPQPWRAAARALLLMVLVWAVGLPAPAQGLFPGQGTPAPSAAPAAAAEAPAGPAQALIDILRDDTARAALIAELERAAPATPAPAPVPDPAASPPETALGVQALAFTRAMLEALRDEAQVLWLRLKRVPDTITLSLRAFERDVLANAGGALISLFFFCYLFLFLARLILRPLQRRIARYAVEAGWLRMTLLRALASGMDALAVPVVVTVGAVVALVPQMTEAEDPTLATVHSLFLNAFIAVELARVIARFLLSPRRPELRLIHLPEPAVRALWRLAQGLILFVGYGQLLVVPIVSEGISVFVGRALASVLGAIAVLVLLAEVLAVRHRVADWLLSDTRQPPLPQVLRMGARLWHWPVLAYLATLLLIVLTRPGNVLLPVLWATAQMAAAILLGGMALTALNRAMGRRIRIPDWLGLRLPLLEERLNQLRPGVLVMLGNLVAIGVAMTLLDILGVVDIPAFMVSAFGAELSSRAFSVLLILLGLAALWLAVASWVDYRLNPFIGKPPTQREVTLLTLMRNAVTIALVVVGAMSSLSAIGLNIGPLLASAGVLGLAISFGSQKLVEDIITGVFIQLENAMNVGDVVDVGGITGTVEKLTVRSVTLRDVSGAVHMIPFSSASMVTNYMRDFSYHLADMGVSYDADMDTVRAAMQAAFDELRADPEFGPSILGDLEWFGLNSFADSALIVRARIKTVPGVQWAVGRAYNARVKGLFDARGIEIPYPHQTVHYISRDGAPPPVAAAPTPAPPPDPAQT